MTGIHEGESWNDVDVCGLTAKEYPPHVTDVDPKMGLGSGDISRESSISDPSAFNAR